MDHNDSIDADFLKEVPFGVIVICKKKQIEGHICPSTIEKISQLPQKREISE
jgi:hypothetical protein